jgi:hypothetical protein
VSSRFEAAIASITLGCAAAALSETKRMGAEWRRQAKASIGLLRLVLADFAGLRFAPPQIRPQRHGEAFFALLVFACHRDPLCFARMPG